MEASKSSIRALEVKAKICDKCRGDEKDQTVTEQENDAEHEQRSHRKENHLVNQLPEDCPEVVCPEWLGHQSVGYGRGNDQSRNG